MLKKTTEYLKKSNFFNSSLIWLIITPVIISYNFSYSFAKEGLFLYILKLTTLIINALALKAIATIFNDIFNTQKTLINQKEKLQFIGFLSIFIISISLFINKLFLFYNILIIAILCGTFYLNSKLNKNFTLPFVINLGAFLGWTINQDTFNILSCFIYFACLFSSINFWVILNHKEKNNDIIGFKELKIKIHTHIKKFLLLSYSFTNLIIALIGVILGTSSMLFLSVIITHTLFLLQIKFIDDEKFDKYILQPNKYYGLLIFIGILFDKL